MRLKRCKLCGAIIYDEFSGDVCDVCLDDLDESNPYNQWYKKFYNGSSETTTDKEDSE